MIAREAVLNDPEIASLLRRHFIPIAVDNVANRNMTDAEEEFLRDKGLKFSTQGASVFTAGGQLLMSGSSLQPGPVKAMLNESLRRYQAVARREPRKVPARPRKMTRRN